MSECILLPEYASFVVAGATKHADVTRILAQPTVQ